MISEDLIVFKDGWALSRLIRIGGFYEALLEKDKPTRHHPHFETVFKRGRGQTQREAIAAALAQNASDWILNLHPDYVERSRSTSARVDAPKL